LLQFRQSIYELHNFLILHKLYTPMQLAIFLLIVLILAVISALSLKKRFISIGIPDSLFSEILKEKRKIWVCMPRRNDDLPDDKRYPVVYLLDAEEQFANFTNMIQEVNETDGSRIFPEMIVIGIPNTNRSHDLTPTPSTYNATGIKVNDFKRSGSSADFIAFIEKELIPYVASKYPVSDNRILAGHSLGGLTAIDTLLHHTTLFNSYVASDPSVWWDDQLILDQARLTLQHQRFEGRNLFIGIANTLPADIDLDTVRADATSETNHIRSILQLTDMLDSNSANGLNFSYKYYEKYDHAAVASATWRDAMQFLFREDNLLKAG
jgi:predicted alpha/beta superfamily hydrolase